MPSRPFTPEELAVLERLCAGGWPGADIARLQLASARYSGKTHPPDDGSDGDACFDIEVSDEVPLLEDRQYAELNSLCVEEGDDSLGYITLISYNGLLSQFEFTEYGAGSARSLPRVDQLITWDEAHARDARRAVSSKRASSIRARFARRLN